MAVLLLNANGPVSSKRTRWVDVTFHVGATEGYAVGSDVGAVGALVVPNQSKAYLSPKKTRKQ